jgi:hypothetical protein
MSFTYLAEHDAYVQLRSWPNTTHTCKLTRVLS